MKRFTFPAAFQPFHAHPSESQRYTVLLFAHSRQSPLILKSREGQASLIYLSLIFPYQKRSFAKLKVKRLFFYTLKHMILLIHREIELQKISMATEAVSVFWVLVGSPDKQSKSSYFIQSRNNNVK